LYCSTAACKPEAGEWNDRTSASSEPGLRNCLGLRSAAFVFKQVHRCPPSIPSRFSALAGVVAALGLCLLQTGCGPSPSGGGGEAGSKVTIQNKGSDTMVNLAQAWAEEYRKVAPDVSVEVSGGGSGVGITSLLEKTCDIADASREAQPKEIAAAKERNISASELIRGLINEMEHKEEQKVLREAAVSLYGDYENDK